MTDCTSNPTRSFGHPLLSFATRVADRARQIRHRRKLKRLMDLDDHMLKDVGVTRGEIEIATGLPLSVDAATELRRMSLERRQQFM